MARFDSGASTHVGHRANNEDAYCSLPDLGLYAVADGLGGYEGGEIASATAIKTLSDFIKRKQPAAGQLTGPASREFREHALIEAFALAHQEIQKRQVGRFALMGSTLSALLLAPNEATLCHVGDSRIYMLRKRELQQLTQDHTLLAEISGRGVEVPAEQRFLYGNELTRALGLEDASEPDCQSLPVEPLDVFLLCSDGLHGALPVETIRRELERGPAQEESEELVQRAYRAGATDNMTAVVVRVLNE